MTQDVFAEEKKRLTPESGFDLVGIDFFAEPGNQLYLVKHFEMYQDALNEKNKKKNPDEYFVLYKDASGEFFCR